jgi:nicotinamidase-related amidase
MTSCVPAPESAADCGLPLALSATFSEAVRAPEAAGVNIITIVQLPPATTEELQVLFSVKSVGSDPVNVMLEMLSAALPELLRVTDCVEQLVSAGQFPKVTLEGERLAAVLELVPVPNTVTLCVLPAALSVTVRAAVRDPLAVGVKVTLIEQLAPAATELPHVLVWAKSLGLVPVRAMLVMVKAALPVLLRVRV